MKILIMLEKVEKYKDSAIKNLDPEKRGQLGQYYTPIKIARFMASLFLGTTGKIKILDPGSGIGLLTAAFVEAQAGNKGVTEIEGICFDVEENTSTFLRKTFSICKSACESNHIDFNGIFYKSDFITESVDFLMRDLQTNNLRLGGFTHVIMNPPYKKINSNSAHRKALSRVGIETVNLYSAFVALAIKLLQPNGELVAIIPRSFCNGPYYESFRKFLLNETKVSHIHIFHKRDHAFSDDEVLQENVILHCVKGLRNDKVVITSSSDAEFEKSESDTGYFTSDMTMRQVDFESIVKPNDEHRFIHIAATSIEQQIVDKLGCFTLTLDDLGIEVSTGPVVDFRLSKDLRMNLTGKAVPLLYPIHLNGSVVWPKESKKPNAIMVSKDSKPYLWENKGYFVITRRFSSKEERRRIKASLYSSNLPGELIGFDNKLNVFHKRKLGLQKELAQGLFVYLNSSLIDLYYRQFGGHTQVNALDLRSLHYPSLDSLLRIGKNINLSNITQEEIDNRLNSEITFLTGNKINPFMSQMYIDSALQILSDLGMPKQQLNERSALTLLALLDLRPSTEWKNANRPLMGVTPIMDWCREHYGKDYAPNTRETFRRQTLHQFVDAGIAILNPDDPERPINSPKSCYQILPELHSVLITFGTKDWASKLKEYLSERDSLVKQYAKARETKKVPVKIGDKIVTLSPGEHSQLIRDIVNEFAPIFAPGSELLYMGDTGSKSGHYDKKRLAELGIELDGHGKMPDVIFFYSEKKWLILAEAVTSHGPVDAKRHRELQELFSGSKVGIVYVTAFPNKKALAEYLQIISWETEVWTADEPTHLIHFNGARFLGPYNE